MASPNRVFIVTGANSGLGFKASLDLALHEDAHVIMTGRSLERVVAAAERVREACKSKDSIVETALLDLSSIASVQDFCETIKSRSPALADLTILCNAGTEQITKSLTVNGLETTFAANHLGHFQLVTSLLAITKRVVVISSETHDPTEKTPVPPPNVSDLEQLARGYEKFDGHEAYATSKLLNLLFMNELLRRNPGQVEAIAYTPGFTPDTQLLRNRDSTSFDIATILAICKERCIPVSTSEASGAVMAQLCYETDWSARGWGSGMYIRVNKPHEMSDQAKDPELARAVWNLSEKLIKDAGALL